MAENFYTNLPPKQKDQLDKTIQKLTTSNYEEQYQFNVGEYDSTIAFFVKRGFQRAAAESTAYVILSQAKIDNVSPQSILDKIAGSTDAQLSELITIVLNSNRLESPGELGLSISTASNTLGGNARKFFDSVKLGKYFQAKRQEQITSRHYFVRATANDFNATTNETFYTESVAGVKRIISGLQSDPKTFITTVGMYNSDNELLAIAKLSKPIIKSRAREALIKVKLDF